MYIATNEYYYFYCNILIKASDSRKHFEPFISSANSPVLNLVIIQYYQNNFRVYFPIIILLDSIYI